MKLWYQSFARVDRFTRYASALEEIASGGVDDSVDIDVFSIPRKAGHADHQFRYYEMVDARDVVSNALRAEEQGYDAYLIGNILDPALHYAREVVDMPVLGLCDTAITAACLMGRTYAFVAINEQQGHRLELNVRDHGSAIRFKGWVSLGIDNYPSIDDNYDSEGMQTFVRRFSEHVETLAERGTEVVIPGGGVVMGLLARAGLNRVGPVPVVEGIRALASFGAMAGATYRRQGHFTSKRLAYAGPPPEAMEHIRKTKGADLIEGPIGMPEGQ